MDISNKIFMRVVVCPVADVGNVHAVACSPSSRFQSTPYSLSMMSSIVGPAEEAFGSGEVVPPSIGRTGLCGRKMAALQ